MTDMNTSDFVKIYDEFMLKRQRERLLVRPNFIGVGAGRCGTSALFKLLSEQEDIHLSPAKEINFFGYRSVESDKHGLSFREYLTFFMGGAGKKIVGEISPIYLFQDSALEQIKKHIANPKILITLRSPIARALSHYKHHLKFHKISDVNIYFDEGLTAFRSGSMGNWFSPARSLRQSLYANDVSRAVGLFGKDNIHFIFFDDLAANPGGVISDLSSFLGVPITGELTRTNFSSRENLKLDHRLQEGLSDLFREDIDKLAALLHRDLSAWLTE